MRLVMLLALIVAPIAGSPQSRLELAPGAAYDSRIPTALQVLGHEFGDEISTPEQIVAYVNALARAAPERTRLVEYARSWEGRPLHLLVIASPERIARLDEVKADLRRLADPRSLGPADADRLVKELPVVTWLMHAVHGDEITPSDAALAEAYHLLASRGDAAVEAILRESIVLIDPLQNPDGRARFLATHRQARAAAPDPEPFSAEHDQPWPGGRPNHYLFDMNRDWLAISQPETAGRVRIGLEWCPHVAADLHEMGGDSTYYFAPPADPANPHITSPQMEWLRRFGRENARRFDQRGFAYFVREVFDSFYPGYGEAWPLFQGAIGMTFEQASPRGLVFRRENGTLLTYREGVVQQFTAAITTAETAARHREAILRDFLEYRRTAIAEGETGAVREYLFPPPGHDHARLERLGRLLAAHGIEVHRAEEPVKVASRTLPVGTLVVPAAQPVSRLLRNLVDPTIQMDEAFIKEQERRRKKRLGDQIYDLTAWSLPLAFDIDVVTADRPSGARTRPFVSGGAGAAPALPAARVAYLIPWGSGAASAIAEALQAGIRVQTAGEPFTIGGRTFGIGTAVVRVAGNPDDLAARLGAIAARHHAEVVPTDTGWVDEGISLGSNRMVELKVPRVLLLWDTPTSSSSAGAARFALERRLGQPVTAVRVNSIGAADLRRFNVIVIPSGNYTAALGEDRVRALREWISAGGTLVTIGEASRWAARERVGLLGTRTELRDGRPDTDTPPAEKRADDPPKVFDLEQAIQPERERPESLAGAMLRVHLDREHWLSAGLDEEIQAIVEGNRVFTPIKLDRGRNVGVYAPADRLVAGGFAWESSKTLLPQKAFLLHQPIGRGHVVAFAEEPNYRAFCEATQLLFANAVLLGPGH